MEIRNKTILLTGAGGGIGRSFAAALAEAGATLILVARNQGGLDSLLADLPGSGHRVVLADIRTAEDRARVVRSCADGLDVLINNAGVNHFGLLESQSEEQLREMMEVNALGPMLLIQGLLPSLLERESAIINVGSGFGSIGFAGYCGYSASKFALRGFTEALRRELVGTPVRVAYLAPRATRTAMNTAAVVAMNEALGNRMDDPERVAGELLALLRNKQKNRYIGWPERFFVRLNGLFPGLVDRALGGQLPVIRRQALASSGDQR
jgi:short-subunit dehydrogenase